MPWVLYPESKVFLNISSILSMTWGKVSQGWGPAFSSVMEYMMPWNLGTCTSFHLKCAQYHLTAFTINIHSSFLLLNKTLILFRYSLSSMWPRASEDVDPIPSPKKRLMIGLSQSWWSQLALPGIDLSKGMWHSSGQWMWVKTCWGTAGKADKKINERRQSTEDVRTQIMVTFLNYSINQLWTYPTLGHLVMTANNRFLIT